MGRVFLIIAFLSFSVPAYPFLPDDEIALLQKELAMKPIGERIAFWAEKFVGTLYDSDPHGEYVTKKAIVADERVDCMYLTFRVVELSLAKTPTEAVTIALDKRFIGKGRISEGRVANYEDRFQRGEDMMASGKWGRDVTEKIGLATETEVLKDGRKIKILSKGTLRSVFVASNSHALQVQSFRSGDLIFFVKSPAQRISDEVVGHIGIVKEERDILYLIHAKGMKNRGGVVEKVLLSKYIISMPFVGIRISRFE